KINIVMAISIRSEGDILAIRRPDWSCVVGRPRGQRRRKPARDWNGKQVAAKAEGNRRAVGRNCGISEPEGVDLRSERRVFTGDWPREQPKRKGDKDCAASSILQHGEEIGFSRVNVSAIQELVVEAHEGQRVKPPGR